MAGGPTVADTHTVSETKQLSPARCICLTLLAATLCWLLAAPGRADAYVYWANLGGFGSGELGRANLDGTEKDRKFIRGAIGPVAITADAHHVYWINGDGGTIGRARLDGSKVDENFIRGVGFARDLTISGGKIYWSIGETIGGGTSIARADVDGSHIDLNFIPFHDPAHFSTPSELEVHGDYIYWANSYADYTIGRARIDGTDLDQNLITGLNNPFGLAITNTHIYWSNRGTRSISRANLDGTDPEIDFIPKAGRISSLAVDEKYIYWPAQRGVMRTRLDGSKAKELIARAPAISVFVDGLGPRA